jgi:hypothetical protein
LAGALAIGCGAKAKTVTPPDPVPLAMPAPPPRVQTLAEEELLASSSPSLPEGPIAGIALPSITKPAPPRNRQPAQNTDPKPERSNTGAVSPTPQEPTPQLRTLSAAEQADLLRVEQHLKTAQTNLDKVEERSLSAGNREQYENARQFIESARKALAEQRISYALAQAEKAMKIALELAPR